MDYLIDYLNNHPCLSLFIYALLCFLIGRLIRKFVVNPMLAKRRTERAKRRTERIETAAEVGDFETLIKELNGSQKSRAKKHLIDMGEAAVEPLGDAIQSEPLAPTKNVADALRAQGKDRYGTSKIVLIDVLYHLGLQGSKRSVDILIDQFSSVYSSEILYEIASHLKELYRSGKLSYSQKRKVLSFKGKVIKYHTDDRNHSDSHSSDYADYEGYPGGHSDYYGSHIDISEEKFDLP